MEEWGGCGCGCRGGGGGGLGGGVGVKCVKNNSSYKKITICNIVFVTTYIVYIKYSII